MLTVYVKKFDLVKRINLHHFASESLSETQKGRVNRKKKKDIFWKKIFTLENEQTLHQFASEPLLKHKKRADTPHSRDDDDWCWCTTSTIFRRAAPRHV